MKVVCVLLSLLLAAVAVPSPPELEEWRQFKLKYKKEYASHAEEQYRRDIFLSNRNSIQQHNVRYKIGQVSFSMKMNKLGDKLPTEVLRPKPQTYNVRSQSPSRHRRSSLPNTVDWRDHNRVTPVKDQGECGSCYAFSAVGALEGQIARKNGQLISLSTQQLMDCSQSHGNNGCEGPGFVDKTFQYIKDRSGIASENDYTYEGKLGTCRYRQRMSKAKLTGYTWVDVGEEPLKAAVASVGPISINVDSNHTSFMFYESNVYEEPQCSDSNLNHNMLVVGYGNQNGRDYWLVKNSYGDDDWGESGYIKMVRNRNNNCGIASEALYPNV